MNHLYQSMRNCAKEWLGPVKRRMFPATPSQQAVITHPVGKLDPTTGRATLVMAVGPGFKQHIPNAMMTARMGYCHAFEDMGIPYIIVDVSDLKETLAKVPNPITFIVGYEYGLPSMDKHTIAALSKTPHAVWVNPWFAGSDLFYQYHNLDASIWDFTPAHRRKILDSQPGFVFTATAPRGMNFFEQWDAHGLRSVSMPLACDTRFYHRDVEPLEEFNDIDMAFVGGYWASKAKQIDPYLKPFEKQLAIYGYSKWPYEGYRGQLPRNAEAALYMQAKLCPTVNEPTVAILHGQINERVFKILGTGGCTLVDAIPAYRDFFHKDELLLPDSQKQFVDMAHWLLEDDVARDHWASRGRHAVLNRHTYHHRAVQMLRELGLNHLLPAGDEHDAKGHFPFTQPSPAPATYRKAS